MRTARIKAAGVLTAAAVVMSGCSGGVDASALLQQAATTALMALPDPVSSATDLDAMGGSGTAGIDPVEAEAVTQAEQASLTGDITFSVPSGTFSGQVSVGLSAKVTGAQIRYTTNGAVPTSASTLYQGSPVVLTRTTQLRAQAFVNGAASGAMGTAMYVARSVTATHDLPLLVMDAYGGGKPARDYRDVTFMLMAPQNNSTSLAQTPTVATRAGFHLRGGSSANFEKAPYRVELRDNANADADYPLLNMPADSDWVLRGPFPDKTLIRDAFAFGVGRDMGLQVPRYALVELYLNLDSQPMAANDYQGVYMLVETIKRSPDRLNIQKMKETDLSEPAVTGGYILQFNMMASEPPLLQCTQKAGQPCWSDLEVIEPDNLQTQQQTWITNYVQRLHDALHSANPANAQTGYPAYIDVNSFINRIIHNELAREGDAYLRSTHFYKDRGGKLVAGPLWDYDLGYAAFTGFGGMGGSTVQGWQFQPMFGMTSTTDWFLKLMQNQTFSQQVNSRWQQLRQGVLSNAQMNARIATLTSALTRAAQRNFQRWPNLGTATVGGFGTQVTQTWDQQIQIMRDFLSQRAAWLDSSGWRV
ncbi:MAG: CotH kinase family protein [Micromonosporaceae bacterium]|nr:CotH kinase family protein [Micromonosporaceae bacterium]